MHRAIQAAFGWYDYHLFEFHVDGETYDCEQSDLSLTLAGIHKQEIVSFSYLYDFGDKWWVTAWIVSTKEIADGPMPRLLAARRNAPPEDVGGTCGYADYVAILADKRHDRRKELLAWRGPFNPAEVPVETVSMSLDMIGGSAAPDAAMAADVTAVLAAGHDTLCDE